MTKLILTIGILFSVCLYLFAQPLLTATNSKDKEKRKDQVNKYGLHNSVETIKQFFELMHQKKITEWENLWDDNGFIYIPYPVENLPDTIKTKRAIGEGFKELFACFKSFDYTILNIYPTVDPDIAIAEYTVSAVLLKTNAIYNGKNIAVFKFRNGKILAYHDYFNPEKFKMVIEAMENQNKK
jgi:ketosteroid isomerase-like protein